MTHHQCSSHPNQAIVKFCTLKQCILPLCELCQPIHIAEHTRTNTRSQIILFHTVYSQTVTQLQYLIKATQYQQNQTINQANKYKSQIISIIHKHYTELLQSDQKIQDLQENLNKIKSNSLKAFITYYSNQPTISIQFDCQHMLDSILKDISALIQSKKYINQSIIPSTQYTFHPIPNKPSSQIINPKKLLLNQDNTIYLKTQKNNQINQQFKQKYHSNLQFNIQKQTLWDKQNAHFADPKNVNQYHKNQDNANKYQQTMYNGYFGLQNTPSLKDLEKFQKQNNPKKQINLFKQSYQANNQTKANYQKQSLSARNRVQYQRNSQTLLNERSNLLTKHRQNSKIEIQNKSKYSVNKQQPKERQQRNKGFSYSNNQITNNHKNNQKFQNIISKNFDYQQLSKQVRSPQQIRKMLQRRVEEKSKLLQNKGTKIHQFQNISCHYYQQQINLSLKNAQTRDSVVNQIYYHSKY